MKHLNKYNYQITYPYESELKQKSFIRIQSEHETWIGLANESIVLMNITQKHAHPITIFSNYQKPNEHHIRLLNQATKKIRSILYKVIFVHENQYLCIGYQNDSPISFVILTIDLNTKGYYEIQKIIDLLKNEI